MKKFHVSFDQAFDQVIDGCGDDKRPQGWINKEIKIAYKKLFELGYVHSVEVWNKNDELVGDHQQICLLFSTSMCMGKIPCL